jgi:hypothetical protein
VSPERLLRLALRLKDLANLTDEETSMSPHSYPGILPETLGGPIRKRHLPHDTERPRGIVEAEEDDDSTEE